MVLLIATEHGVTVPGLIDVVILVDSRGIGLAPCGLRDAIMAEYRLGVLEVSGFAASRAVAFRFIDADTLEVGTPSPGGEGGELSRPYSVSDNDDSWCI